MTKRQTPVPVRYYLRLADVLAKDGIDIAQTLIGLGYSPTALMEPDATINFSDVERLITLLRKQTDRTDLGFELGKYLTVGSHSIVGFGMLSCANLAESLRFVGRYFRLVMPSFQLRYVYTPDRSVLHFSPIVAMGHECLSFHIETIAMAAFHEVQELSGQRMRASRISMSIPRPPHTANYERFSDVDFRYGQETTPGVKLYYDGNMALVPLTLADPNSLKMAESRCQAQISQVARVGEFSGWVAMTLREVGDRLPTLPELADMLSISTRTLNRYLQREGTSFRELHTRIQHELAKERLTAGTMSISSVAYSLGFTDASNFAHAFKRREGISPREYRDQSQKPRPV